MGIKSNNMSDTTEKNGSEALNLFGFIMYVIGLMWAATALIATAIFTAAIKSEETRKFFAIDTEKINTHILSLALLVVILSLMAWLGKKILNKTSSSSYTPLEIE